eukprot:scaffold50475_cov66-Phaeocystis_antarctica.AAC.1
MEHGAATRGRPASATHAFLKTKNVPVLTFTFFQRELTKPPRNSPCTRPDFPPSTPNQSRAPEVVAAPLSFGSSSRCP